MTEHQVRHEILPLPSQAGNSPLGANRTAERIEYLDIFRFLTVTLALLSHALGQFGVFTLLPDTAAEVMMLLTRTATPGLLILVGIMTELVYVRRFQKIPAKTVSDLIYRSLICYMNYVFLAAVALTVGLVGLSRFAISLTFAVGSPHAQIFQLYTLLLVAIIPIVWLRVRFGLFSAAFMAATVWVVHFAIIIDLPVAPNPFRNMAALLVGAGGIQGPSILHSLFLVMCGMVVGAAFFSKPASRTSVWLTAGLAAACTAIIFVSIHTHGLDGFETRLLRNSEWRHHNHPAYFAFGVLCTFAIIGLSWLGYRLLPSSLQKPAKFVGRHTLPYFALGNALLLISPSYIGSLPGAVLSTIAVLFIAGALTYVWAKLVVPRSSVQYLQHAVKSFIESYISRPKALPSSQH